MPKKEELEDDLKPGADGGETVTLDDEDDLPEGKKPDAKAAQDDDVEDERLAADQRDEGETEDEREAIRARRREEKKQRKQAQREAMERTRRELAQLRAERDALAQRMAVLETGQLGTNAQILDQRIQEAEYRARQAEEALARAIENSNGEVARDAVRLRDRALAERAHYLEQRRAIEHAAKRPQQTQDQGMDPVVQRMASNFIQKNSDWYDPQGGNEDSAIVLAIDNTLAAEGYDPRTREYWSELEKRAAKRLPDRFGKGAQDDDDEDDDPAPRRKAARGGPPVGGRSEHAPASTRREVYVSAERKEAMIQAGVWDDPVARKRMLKRYAEIDRQTSR